MVTSKPHRTGSTNLLALEPYLVFFKNIIFRILLFIKEQYKSSKILHPQSTKYYLYNYFNQLNIINHALIPAWHSNCPISVKRI